VTILDRALRIGEGKKFKAFEKRVGRINDFEPELELDSEEELRERADQLRERARNGEPLDDLLPESFALTREASKRTLGQRHFDVQLIGGMVLHDGSIAEMKTGEGKTLTATLPIVLNSLLGKGVHLVTVNDYLARRDAEWMRPIYETLGVSVGVIQAEERDDTKHAAYAADVTYGTNSEFGFDNMYLAEHGNLVNHLIQALKAESLYRRDVDYAVIDGEAKIIDEFTGRILEGRRWSEGLHQAVEAKEGVPIQEENQTVATITYQTYFRRYDKLAGMTGTAITEATEFMKIYELQVVEIPTNEPMVRADNNDQIYKTKDGKWKAVVQEIEDRHHRGQPVLVGTISVEVSELLSDRLTRKGIKHTVLNAKPEHAEREGEIVAEAGRVGAVTIATNMAGRGVDIKLGGNAEHLTTQTLLGHGLEPGTKEWDVAWDERFSEIETQVDEARDLVVGRGGLFILGTERHESRRIDNQLRGRSGRQGDPGESRFYLSAEDDLVRLFAGDRIYRIPDRLGPVDKEGEEEAIEAGMLSKQIENAQKKVEEQNFLIRKRVLEYDDVMNQQREIIYTIRDRILEGEDMSETARTQIADSLERLADEYMVGDYVEDWDLEGLWTQLEQIYDPAIYIEDLDVNTLDREWLVSELRDDVVKAYDDREEELGPELMRELERFILLQIIDERWREHLHDMDYLREGIHLRGFAQEDPLVAYKNEGFEMFTGLVNSIWEEFGRYIFRVEVEIEGQNGQGQQWAPAAGSSSTGRLSYAGGRPEDQPSALAAAAAGAIPAGIAQAAEHAADEVAEPVHIETRRLDENQKLGRNEPCWCGSGKKFKNCHGA